LLLQREITKLKYNHKKLDFSMESLLEKTFKVPEGRFKVSELTDVLGTVFGESCTNNGYHNPGHVLNVDGGGTVDKGTIISPIIIEGIGSVVTVRETRDRINLNVHNDTYIGLFRKGEQKVIDYFTSIGGEPLN